MKLRDVLLLPLLVTLWALTKIGFLTQKLLLLPVFIFNFFSSHKQNLPHFKYPQQFSRGEVFFNTHFKKPLPQIQHKWLRTFWKLFINDLKVGFKTLFKVLKSLQLPHFKMNNPAVKLRGMRLDASPLATQLNVLLAKSNRFAIKSVLARMKSPAFNVKIRPFITQNQIIQPQQKQRIYARKPIHKPIQTPVFLQKPIYTLGRWIKWTLFSVGLALVLVLTSFFLTIAKVLYKLAHFFFVAMPLTFWHFLGAIPRFFLKRRYRRLFKLRFSTAFIIFVIFILGFMGVYTFYLVELASQLPSPTRLSDTNGPLTTTFYDRNGKVLYRLYDDKNRSLVKIDDVPSYLIQATISIEDKNFYKHQGVDFQGLARVAWLYFDHKEVTGGSTITQQLIKNTLLTPERTFDRKLKEMILAFWTERLYAKGQILQMYLNEVAYGGQSWGIAAASQMYFGKSPHDLTLAESAYLAGLTASPTAYSPYGPNPQFGKQRQQEVLRRMVEEKYITQQQAQDASKTPLNIKPPLTQINAPHFVMYLKQLLAEKYGERFVQEGGLQVYTSLDLDVQKMAEKVVKDQVQQLGSLDVSNGAAMITDAKTGQILAMVGSKDYWDGSGGNFNVTIANRQPGSSIKPITYATAFKQGYTPGSVVLDTPTSWSNAWETYAPVNYDGKFHGAVTLRTALGSSFNIPAVKMLDAVGIPNMIKTAQDMGITTFTNPDRYGLSLTLGGGEVKMIDMMSVYGTFSQLGTRYDSQPVIKIIDAKGTVIEDNTTPTGNRVLPRSIAYLITDILTDNTARIPAFGPNSLLIIPNHTVAVKTGTTDSKRDNWTFGYTPNYVVGVWVGNNDNHPMNPALTSGVTGAAPIWHELMVNLLANKPNIAFERPAEVVPGVVGGNKDLVISGQGVKSIGEQNKPKDNLSLNKDPGILTPAEVNGAAH